MSVKDQPLGAQRSHICGNRRESESVYVSSPVSISVRNEMGKNELDAFSTSGWTG